MRNAIRVMGVVAALALCAASATGYRQSYTESNLGGGAYMVVVEVNKHTSAATARQYAFQRASEVCGAGGFTPLGADGNSYAGSTVMTTQNIGNTTVTTAGEVGGGHDFTLMYQCNSGVGGSRSYGSTGTGAGNAGVPRPEDLPRQ